MLTRFALGLLPFVTTGERCRRHLFTCMCLHFIQALAQVGGAYVDPDNGITFFGYADPIHSITYGITFPPLVSTGANSTEFIGEIVAPIATTAWAGVSPGGAMLNNLLLVAWPNAGSIVSSARMAS